MDAKFAISMICSLKDLDMNVPEQISLPHKELKQITSIFNMS